MLSGVWVLRLQPATWKHEYNARTSSLLCNVSNTGTYLAQKPPFLIWAVDSLHDFEIVQIGKKRGTLYTRILGTRL